MTAMGNPQSKDNIIVGQSPNLASSSNQAMVVGMELSEILLLTIVVVLAGYIILRVCRQINAYLLDEIDRRAARRAFGPEENC